MAVRGVAGRHRRGVPIARWAQSLHGSGKVSEGPVLLYSWASATANLIHCEVTDRSLLRASLGAHAARSTTAAAVMLPRGGAFGEDITTKPRPARLKTGKYGRRKGSFTSCLPMPPPISRQRKDDIHKHQLQFSGCWWPISQHACRVGGSNLVWTLL